MSTQRFKSIKVFEGLYLILDKTNSPYYQVRIRVPDLNKHIVRSSKTTSLVEAKFIAKEFWKTLSQEYKTTKTNSKFQLTLWCKNYIKYLESNKPDKDYRTEFNRLLSDETGLCRWFGLLDITEFHNTHVLQYFEYRDKDSNLTNNTKNKYISLFKSFLKYCFNNSIIQTIPEIPTLSVSKRDNPRPSFTFQGKNNEYDLLLKYVRESVKNKNVRVRFNVINQELHKAILIVVHGFIRPVSSELMSLKWNDVEMVNNDDIKTIQFRIKDGKTGFRFTSSTSILHDYFVNSVVSKNNKPDDYIIYNEYKNRSTALRILQDQFKEVLSKTGMTKDEYGQNRSLYSLRHLGIQMRLVNSKGKINIYFLAKNCGTSVEMIERFYAKYLPNSVEVMKNLQSFG